MRHSVRVFTWAFANASISKAFAIPPSRRPPATDTVIAAVAIIVRWNIRLRSTISSVIEASSASPSLVVDTVTAEAERVVAEMGATTTNGRLLLLIVVVVAVVAVMMNASTVEENTRTWRRTTTTNSSGKYISRNIILKFDYNFYLFVMIINWRLVIDDVYFSRWPPALLYFISSAKRPPQ